jgi:hypothetical protein
LKALVSAQNRFNNTRMTEPFWLAQQDITEEKVTQRDGQTPYETNKEREREQRHKMKSYNNFVV